MNLIHLEYFTAVCRLGSTTQAAQMLSVSQPAVSAAIRELEKEFGILLFERVGKRLEITDAGRKLFTLANDLLEKAENTAQIMADIAQKRNRLRLGISPMQAALILPRLFETYRNAYPDVLFTVREGGRHDLFQKLDDRELDMVICSRNQELDAGYQKQRLLDLEFAVCMNPNHPLAQKGEITVQDLAHEPIAVFSMGSHQRQILEKMFADHGLRPNIVFETSQISTMFEMVSHGLVSSFMYKELSGLRPDLSFLSLAKDSLEDPYIPISLYWRKGDFIYSDMENLMNCVRSMKLDIQRN